MYSVLWVYRDDGRGASFSLVVFWFALMRLTVNVFCSVLIQDMNFRRQMQRPRQNNKAEITTEEVLKKADFRVSFYNASEACVSFVGFIGSVRTHW